MQCTHRQSLGEINGLYFKPIMIVNNNSRVINKLETSYTDDARVIIYNGHMFIVQATNNGIGMTQGVNPTSIVLLRLHF